MVSDNQPDNEPDDESRGIVDWPRRNVLKLAGAGIGLAGIGGAMAVTGSDDDEDDGTDDDHHGNHENHGGSSHFISDLVDPTFGYPLAADETDDLELEHVVDVTLEEGPGAHPGFPTEDFGEPVEEFEGTPNGTVETPSETTGTPPGTTTPTGTGTPAGTDGTPPGTDGTPGGPGEIPVEFFFDPVGLWVEPGALVHFKDIIALHTVTAYHEKFSEPQSEIPNRVPEGVPGFTSPPLVADESWVYEFEKPGVYDYFCFPHLGLGMVGRIVVFDPKKHDIEDETFATWGTDGLYPNDAKVLTAPELDPAYIVEHRTVAWSDITLDGEPMETETATGTETETETDGETETATEPTDAGTATDTEPCTESPSTTQTE